MLIPVWQTLEGKGMRYNSLDGLRGVAAYTVVISHFSNHTDFLGGLLGQGAGQQGVMLFFVLSGFLMARLYADRPFDRQSVVAFFQHRISRVVPLFILVVLTSYFWRATSGSHWPLYDINDQNLVQHLTFWRGWDVFWTIPVEVQFYALFPIFWFAYRKLGASLIPWIGLLIAVLATIGYPRTPALLPYLPFFLIGAAISMLPRMDRHAANALFVICAAAYILEFPQIRNALGSFRGGFWESPIYMLLMPALLVAALDSPVADRTLGTRPMRFLGNISYSVYLLHYPVLYALTSLEVANVSLFLAIFLAVTTMVGWLSFRFFELPVRGFMNNVGRRRAVPAAALP
jgi:peptidoglycan/LPS O-acetylase OafA/YrhL